MQLTRFWLAVVVAVGTVGTGNLPAQDASSAANSESGLTVSYSGPGAGKDVCAVPNVWLYVPAGKPATPFVAAGKFTADWNGSVTVDLRGEYVFDAELNGSLKLELNGEVALEVTGTNALVAVAPGKTIKLNRGANILKAHFASPAQGDAVVRLRWKPPESFFQPIPPDALSHADSAELKPAGKIHSGRELFADFRCAKCHVGPGADGGMPELTMDAPAFEGIGSRRNYGWMTAWIQDPKARRGVAHMPKLLHGATAKEDAVAMAAFLASLKMEGDKPGIEPKAEQSDDGKALFDSLHCAACHNGPDATEADEKKIYLKQVREKFAPGMLAGFLLKPEAQFVWTRMPNFKLSEDQANQLAAYLNSTAYKPKEMVAPADGAVIEKGRKLVQTSGCLNCHSLKLENQFSAKPLAELAAQRWQQGCMAALHDEKGKAPEFGFTAEEREALQAFAATDRGSLTRSAPAEFAERQTRLLNCRECHGKVEGVPAFDILGGKLRPEWSKAFIAGEISYKPRPWLEARMPAFANRAALLAEGLAMQHGYPPQTPAEPPVDMEAAKLGQKLISAAGGFSCVSCHKVGDAGATQVFETAGINFAYTGERLMQPYFERWTRYPQLIDPATKMPTYFDEHGKSQLTTILDGDGAKQINALWQYVRLGSKMPPPPTQ